MVENNALKIFYDSTPVAKDQIGGAVSLRLTHFTASVL